MSVGWQVIITKDECYVSNGRIKANLEIALEEARADIDSRLDDVAPALKRPAFKGSRHQFDDILER